MLNKLVSIVWQLTFLTAVLVEGSAMHQEIVGGAWRPAAASFAIALGCVGCMFVERKYRIR